ncbi:MAG: HhH-GPD-type base excision DNA repair protein [Actinomycetota bacterium]
MTLAITGDEAADHLLNTNGTALLIGMLLDQQVPMEWAFRGPATLEERLGHMDATRIAAMDEDDFVELCRRKPAIHRFPQSMGRRIHALCRHLTEEYDGDGSRLWGDDPDAATLFGRVSDLPGFGKEKSMIFMALLAKRFEVRPAGWEEHAGPFADAEPRSAADVDGEENLARVREWKRARKAAGKAKQE